MSSIRNYRKKLEKIHYKATASYHIYMNIESTGKKRENPAFYGAYHDTHNYPFSDEALGTILLTIKLEDIDIDEFYKNPEKVMISHTKEIGRAIESGIVHYILHEMPQKPQPWKKSGKPNLVESGLLLDSFYGTIYKGRRKIWEGR